MGCNCKKTAKIAAKYAGESPTERVPFVLGVLNVLEVGAIAILVTALIIVTLPIIIPVAVTSVFTGKTIRIDRLIRRKREKKQNIQD